MNLRNLNKRLTAPIEKFEELGDCEHTPHGPMIFIDNNAPVLAVAHLDWVDYKKPKYKKQYKNTLIYDCPQLDDRLGVWMILDMLPKAGIKCDVLLTDSEELGLSTASCFKPPKQYNWMMEFDRQGGGTAMYDYEDAEMRQLLWKYDYDVDQGSFTDICELYSLKCKGFNFGVGYHRQHTDECYANLSETFDSFRKVQSMYSDLSNTYLEHEEVKAPIGYTGYTGYSNYQTYKPIVRSYPVTKNNNTITRTSDTDHLLRKRVNNSVKKSKELVENEIQQQQQKEMERIERDRIKDELDFEQENAMHSELDSIALDLYGQSFIYCTEAQKNHVRCDYADHNFK